MAWTANHHSSPVAWLYRCLIEGLFGVKGDRQGLVIQPQLPGHWNEARVVRKFRGATFDITMRREENVHGLMASVNGRPLPSNHFTNITPGKTYLVTVLLPV